jgi:hypothetical protein
VLEFLHEPLEFVVRDVTASVSLADYFERRVLDAGPSVEVRDQPRNTDDDGTPEQ